MAYKIKIFYSTGNSFGSEDVTDELELTWENLDVAKANIKRIQEHYICYNVDSSSGGKKSHEYNNLSPEHKHMYDMREHQDWYYKGDRSYDNYHYSIILKADNGNDYQISTFWVGYFETLYEVEIIADKSDMKIKF